MPLFYGLTSTGNVDLSQMDPEVIRVKILYFIYSVSSECPSVCVRSAESRCLSFWHFGQK